MGDRLALLRAGALRTYASREAFVADPETGVARERGFWQSLRNGLLTAEKPWRRTTMPVLAPTATAEPAAAERTSPFRTVRVDLLGVYPALQRPLRALLQ